MYEIVRALLRLAAIGGAVAVGLITHDAGFTALTFLGGLVLPRLLGFRRSWGARGPWAGGRCGGWKAAAGSNPAPGAV